MKWYKISLIFVSVFCFKTAFASSAEDFGNFEISVRDYRVEGLPGGGIRNSYSNWRPISPVKGNIFYVSGCTSKKQSCSAGFLFKNKTNQQISVTQFVRRSSGDLKLSYETDSDINMSVDRKDIVPAKGSILIQSQFAFQSVLNRGDGKVDIGLSRISFNDGSTFHIWWLFSNRGVAEDTASFSQSVAEVTTALNSGKSYSYEEMLAVLSSRTIRTAFQQNQKEWYTLGAFLNLMPASGIFYDQTEYDKLKNEYFSQPNETQQIMHILRKRSEFYQRGQSVMGDTTMKLLPAQRLKPYRMDAASVAVSPVLPNSTIKINMNVDFQNSKEANLEKHPAASNQRVLFTSISGAALAFNQGVADIKLVPADPNSTLNGAALYDGLGSKRYTWENLYTIGLSNNSNQVIKLKSVNLKGTNFRLSTYGGVEKILQPGQSTSVQVDFSPYTWVLKNGVLKISWLTKFFGSAVFNFETVAAPVTAFSRVVRFSIDHSNSIGVKDALNGGSKFEAFKNFPKFEKSTYLESVERSEDILAVDLPINPTAPFLPLAGEPGVPVGYSYYAKQSSSRRLASETQTGAFQTISLPTFFGRLEIERDLPVAAAAVTAPAAVIEFYDGFNVDGVNLNGQISQNKPLLDAFDAPIKLVQDGALFQFARIKQSESSYKFLSIKNNSFENIEFKEQPLISGNAFQIAQISDTTIRPISSGMILIQFKPLFPGSYYAPLKMKFNSGKPEGYTFWLGGESDSTQTSTVVSASPSPIVVATPRVFINSALVDISQNFETDIGTVKARKDPVWMDVLIQNPSSAPFDIIKVNVDAGFKMDPAVFTAKTVVPRSVIAFKLSIDPTSAGAKSGYLRLTYKVGSVLKDLNFRIGGISWSASLATTENPVLGARPSPNPSPSTDPNFKEFGSEHLALSRAKTSAAYISLIPKITLEEGENILNTAIGTRTDLKSLLDFIRASKRAVLSDGAKSAMESAKADLEKQNPTGYLRKISDLIRTMNNDFLCKGRSDLIRAVSTVPAFKDAVRVYTQLAIKSLAAERLPNTNSLGRYYMRLAFLRAYLSTNPPLEEAWETIQPSLLQLKDDISRAPLLNAFLAQFPEAAYAVAEAAKGN